MAQFVPTTSFDDERYRHDIALKNARLGLVLWRIGNGLIFVFFAFANALMRQAQPSWPPPGVARLDATLPIIITGVLILSWFSAARVQNTMRREDRADVRRSVLITAGLGIAFLAGLMVVSAQIPYSGAYSSIVVAMNLFHAVHTAIGLVLLAWVFPRIERYTRESYWGLEGTVVFWQFIVLMWAFFFAVIYVF
jgi:cytochrome c oxidase subunit 3